MKFRGSTDFDFRAVFVVHLWKYSGVQTNVNFCQLVILGSPFWGSRFAEVYSRA